MTIRIKKICCSCWLSLKWPSSVPFCLNKLLYNGSSYNMKIKRKYIPSFSPCQSIALSINLIVWLPSKYPLLVCGFDIMGQLVSLLLVQFSLVVLYHLLATVLRCKREKTKPSHHLSTLSHPHPKELTVCSVGTDCSLSLNQTLPKYPSQDRTRRRVDRLTQIVSITVKTRNKS